MKQRIKKINVLLKNKWSIIIVSIVIVVIISIINLQSLLAWLRYEHGSVADWFSAIGTLGAIIAVYFQIREQRIEFEKDKEANLKIAIGVRRMRSLSKGITYFSAESEYFFWATNYGNMTGSFKFIGMCKKDDYSKIEKASPENRVSEISNVVIDPDLQYQDFIGDKSREFEKIEPKSVSKQITIPENAVIQQFGKKFDLYILYMDPVGKLFKKEIIRTTDD